MATPNKPSFKILSGSITDLAQSIAMAVDDGYVPQGPMMTREDSPLYYQPMILKTKSSESASQAIIPDGVYVTNTDGTLYQPKLTGTLPDGLVLNGDVYLAGTADLPANLTKDPTTGIVLTDGTVYYPNTINNGGILCADTQ